MSEFLRIAKEEDYVYEKYIPRLFNDFFSRIPFGDEDFNNFIKKNRNVNVLNIDGSYISYGIHLQNINVYIILEFKCVSGFITDTRVDYFVLNPFGKNLVTVLNKYAYKLDRDIVRAIFDDMAKLIAEFKFDYPEYNKINDKEFFDLAQDYFYLATKDAIYNPQEEY